MSVISFQDANALLLYRVGPVLVCSPTLSVESVVMPPKLTATPGSSRAEPGVFKSIHGMVRIVDLRSRFGVDDDDRGSPGRIIVVEVEGGRVGFWVDEIEDVIKSPETGWGQLPTHIPREVFSRTLVGQSDIRLFAEFEDLNKFRSTGYLRKHIEKIKAAALIKSTNASAQIKNTNDAASSNKLTGNNNSKENHQETVVSVPVVKEAPPDDKTLLKPTTDSANKVSPLRAADTLFRSDRKYQQKDMHIKAETTAIKTQSNKAGQQKTAGRVSLSENKYAKKDPVKQEYVTNHQKPDKQQENSRVNASVRNDQLPDYPKDHSVLWLSAVIFLLIIGFVVLVDMEALMTDENKFPNDIVVNKLKTMEYEREPVGSEEQPGLPEEIADMEETTEQSLFYSGNDAEVMDADEIADINNTEMQKKTSVETTYKEEVWSTLDEEETGGAAGSSEAGKVVITKNKENIYIVIDGYDLKSDGITNMAEPEKISEKVSEKDREKGQDNISREITREIPSEKIEAPADKYTNKMFINKNDSNKGALPVGQSDPGVFVETQEIKHQEYNDNIKNSEQFEADTNTGLTISSAETAVASDVIVIDRQEKVYNKETEAIKFETRQLEASKVETSKVETSKVETSRTEQLNDSVDKISNKTSIHLGENIREDAVVDKVAIDLLAKVEDDTLKFSSKTNSQGVQAGADDNIISGSASAVTAETEVISIIESGAVDRVDTGIDINDDARNKARDNIEANPGDNAVVSLRGNDSGVASDTTRDEVIIAKSATSMVENHTAQKTSRRHVHIVVKGDTLWHIAKRYVNNPWRYPELARLSKIKNPDLIYPGNKVIITINYKNKSQNEKSATENH